MKTMKTLKMGVVALAVTMALAGCGQTPPGFGHSVAGTIGIESAASTATPAAVSTAGLSDAQATSNSVSQSSNSSSNTVNAGYGPAIKGMQLGLTDSALTPQLGNTLSNAYISGAQLEQLQSAMRDIKETKDQFGTDSGIKYDAAVAQQAAAVGKMVCNPIAIMAEHPDLDRGEWLIFGIAGRGECSAMVHFNDLTKLADFYEIEGGLSDKLFGSENMSASEFNQALVNSYSLPMMNQKVNDTQFGSFVYGYYESPDGWRIETILKSIEVFKTVPVANRFN